MSNFDENSNKMKKILPFLAILLVSCFSINAQKLVSAQLINTTSASILVFVNPAAKYDVNTYKITYNTTDVGGTPTIASGALMVPVNSGCDQFGLVSYSHGTVLEKIAVPSNNNTEAVIPKLFASAGHVAVAPDYLGLGDNAGLHPYLHAESEATSNIDLMRAAREYIADSLSLTLNGEVFITGYSQGGHAAMASAKYIQDNNLLSEFDIKAVGPASGPYNLSGSQSAVLLSNLPYSNPGYVCYLLFSYNRVYGNIFTNYSDLLKSPYDVTIPPYFNGTYPMDSVNANLPDTISGFLQDSVLANLSSSAATGAHPIWKALQKNDNYNWVPSFPMELYYCTMDEQVGFQNALDAADSMTANGAVSVVAVNKGALDHGGCVIPSLTGALNFFQANGTACVNISLEEKLAQGLISLYPNPANNFFIIGGLEEESYIAIVDINGRVVKEGAYMPFSKFRTDELKTGFYFVRLESEGYTATIKLIMN